MKEGQEDAGHDGDIRKIEHRPEFQVDEIDDAPPPKAVQEIASRPSKRRAQGDEWNRALEERPELNDHQNENGLCAPEPHQGRVPGKTF